MVRNFAARLDRALEEEQPPEGLTPELLAALRDGAALPLLEGAPPESSTEPGAGQGSDLYSLWSAMATLAQEVRVQGRLFKQLNETLVQSVQERYAPGEETAPESPRAPRKQELDLLLDLRDRMERGIASARDAAAELAPARLPRWTRWLGLGRSYAHRAQEILKALSHSHSLTLARLDEALVAHGVDRITCLDRVFDPQCMTAIEIDETGAAPEGTVVEVYRDGYEWNGKIYRTAQVKVARQTRSEFQ